MCVCVLQPSTQGQLPTTTRNGQICQSQRVQLEVQVLLIAWKQANLVKVRVEMEKGRGGRGGWWEKEVS